MEHRYSARIPVAVELLIYHRGVPVIACKTHDVSLGGLFATTGPTSFSKNTMLEVELSFQEQRRLRSTPEHIRVPALVVHRRREGIGLIFDASEPEARRAVKDFIDSQTTLG